MWPRSREMRSSFTIRISSHGFPYLHMPEVSVTLSILSGQNLITRKPMEPRISMITLGVSDLKKSRKFYEKGLGFPVRPESQGDVVFFGLASTWLGLYPRKSLAEDAQVPAKGSGFQGVALAHNVRTQKEVDAL